ncbi:MAG: hypothetical protein ACF8XB_21510 [Planctomycetota bacterium JB042]
MRRTVAAFLLVVLAAAWVPPPPIPVRDAGVDACYWLGLSLAHADGLVHGEEVVFPYGPLAWACHPDPRSGDVGRAVGLQLAWWAAFLAGLFLLARRGAAGFAAAAAVTLALTVDLLGLTLAHLEPATLVWGMVQFSGDARRRGPLLVLAVLAGATLLAKVNAGAAAAFLLTALTVRAAVAEARAGGSPARPLVAPVVGAAALVSLFAWSSGGPGALLSYLASGLELGRGYGAMAHDGLPWRTATVWLGLATVPLVALLVRDRRAVAGGLVLTAGLALLAAKSALVRQGSGHVAPFLLRLAVAFSFVVLAAAAGRDRRLVVLVQLALVGAGTALVLREMPRVRAPVVARVSGETIAARFGTWGRLDAAARAIDARGEERLAGLRLPADVRARIGDATVDVVPWRVATVAANDLRWRPRPVFQDYTAYTPALDSLNAAHWESDRAPRFVLADVESIDGRHVFLEAPSSWRALVDRYALAAATEHLVLIERRDAARFGPEERLFEEFARLGEPLAVPSEGPFVVLRAEVRLSVPGRIRGILLGEPGLFVEATHASGRVRTLRAVRRNLTAGALVSALPADVAELGALFSSPPRVDDPVVSLRLTTDRPAALRSEFAVRWSRLPTRR